MGSDESHFNVSVIVKDKVTRRQCPQTTTFMKRKESRSGIEPRPYRLPALRLTARPMRLTMSGRSPEDEIVHGPGIETLTHLPLPPPPPPPHLRGGIFGDNDFWIAQYVSFQYLLVCKMNYSAFRDYLRFQQ